MGWLAGIDEAIVTAEIGEVALPSRIDLPSEVLKNGVEILRILRFLQILVNDMMRFLDDLNEFG
jgi:hypothetical protein